MIKICRKLIFFLALGLFCISLIFNNLNLMLISIIILLSHNIFFSFEKIEHRVIFFAFQVTFFTFLLGKVIFSNIQSDNFDIQFSEQIIKHIFITLFLSLFFIFLGYVFFENKREKAPIKIIDYNSDGIKILRNISKYIYYISYIPYFYSLFDKVNFVSDNGYLNYYTQYTSSIPFYLVKIGEMSIFSFSFFLATMPSKKECRLPIILYLIYSIVSLGYGQRNTFVLNILFVFIYFVIRNTINTGNQKWLRKKEVIIFLIAIPFLIIFLNNFAYVRVNKVNEQSSAIDSITNFFKTQGGSINVIGYGKELESVIPSNKFYTFGSLINFFRNNVITQYLFHIPQYKSQTVEMALYGSSFGQTISYLVIPGSYLDGSGLGSNYIAEVYKDFGYVGIIIINFIYGFIFAKINKQFRYNVWVSAFLLIIIKYILYSPRAEAISFLTYSINMINILTLCIISFVYIILKNRSYNKGEKANYA